MSARLWLAAALTLLPETAVACASCISSPYGDRTFNLAYLGLLVMPFAVAATVGGVLGYVHLRRSRRPEPPTDPDSQSNPFEETT